jgi:hypothetical protein
MNHSSEFGFRAVLIGLGATAILDLWNLFLFRTFGVRSLDMAFLGRWIGHLPRGRVVHESIAKSAPIPGERGIGWIAHYLIGISFAALLVGLWGLDWARRPSFFPALIIGLVTVVAPFFLLQPGMGLGIAASRTPTPNVARLKSLGTHLVYGIGLYSSALVTAVLFPPP